MSVSLHMYHLRQREQLAPSVAATVRGTGWQALVWVAIAAIAGFGLSAIVAGWLELSRGWVVLAHLVVTSVIMAGFIQWSGIKPLEVIYRHWKAGVAGGLIVAALVVMAVLREDSTTRADGFRLTWDFFWFGVVYGLLDALLLTVLPVMATWRACTDRDWTAHWPGKVAAGVVALSASLLVTAAYHLGYPEFRGSDVGEPLFGNAIMTVGYILTNNPLTAIISHIAMHVAAVWNGAEGVPQLPPHY